MWGGGWSAWMKVDGGRCGGGWSWWLDDGLNKRAQEVWFSELLEWQGEEREERRSRE